MLKTERTLAGLAFALVISLLLVFYPVNAENVPRVIENHDQALLMLDRAKRMLKSHLGMEFRLPIEMRLVTGQELDRLIPNSPYKGNVVGLHSLEKGVHVIRMLEDRGRDDFHGTLCHELTHGWQDENCPNQELTLREGLAVWVQYKALRWDGAYVKARNLNQWLADPVYGVGYRYVRTLEDKHGEDGVLDVFKTLTVVPKNF